MVELDLKRSTLCPSHPSPSKDDVQANSNLTTPQPFHTPHFHPNRDLEREQAPCLYRQPHLHTLSNLPAHLNPSLRFLPLNDSLHRMLIHLPPKPACFLARLFFFKGHSDSSSCHNSIVLLRGYSFTASTSSACRSENEYNAKTI